MIDLKCVLLIVVFCYSRQVAWTFNQILEWWDEVASLL
jgi:hypothetical protein